MGLRLAGVSRRRAFAIGLVTTITVELLQIWIPGTRHQSRRCVHQLVRRLHRSSLRGHLARDRVPVPTRSACRLAAGWTLLWMLVLMASAELAHISLPNTTRVGNVEIRSFCITTTSPDRCSPQRPAGFRHPTPSRRRATMFDGDSRRIRWWWKRRSLAADDRSRLRDRDGLRLQPSQIFMLGQRRGNLIFSLRMRTADARVATPAIRLDSVFPRTGRRSRRHDARRRWTHSSSLVDQRP